MTIEPALLAAIAAEPDDFLRLGYDGFPRYDDFSRLVYADWLDENGQPDRAEFIRIGCELYKMHLNRETASEQREQLLSAREEELWKRNRERWFPGLARFAREIAVGRGFPWYAEMSVRQFIEHGDDLFRIAPTIVNLSLDRLGRNAPALAQCRALSRVQSLTFFGPFRAAQAVAFFASPYLGNLRELDIGHCDGEMGVRGAQALATAESLTQLEILNVGDHAMLDAGTARMLRNSRLATLRVVNLEDNGLTDETAESLAHAEFLSGLRDLDLSSNRLSSSAAEILCRTQHLSGLQNFSLSKNLIGSSGALQIANANFASTLGALCLDDCDLDNEAMTYLFAAGRFSQLSQWNLSGNRPTAQAFRALARNTALPALRILGLDSCALTPALAGCLGDIGTLSGLRCLNLTENPLMTAGVRNLLAGPLLRSVQDLDLSSCQIGDGGARVLAKSRALAELRSLSLRDNGITDSGAKALMQSDTLAGLRELELDDNALTKSGKASVRARFGEGSFLD